MFNFIKKIFGVAESKPLKLSDHIKNKKPLLLVPSKKDMTKMTKAQLEKMGRKHGIELDRRLTKPKLVNQLYKHMKSK